MHFAVLPPALMFSRTVARSYSAAASGYSAPLAQGVLPAYDQAIRFLAKDRETKLAALDADTTLDAAAREAKEIDAWVNDPETRWKAKNGQGENYRPFLAAPYVHPRPPESSSNTPTYRSTKFQLLTTLSHPQAISRNRYIDISPNEPGARRDR